MNDNPPTSRGDSSVIDDSAFEDLLRTAMQSRPDERPASDLAHRAMVLGRAHDAAVTTQRAARLARQRWWLQVTGLAATLLIVAMLAGVAHRLWTRGDIAAIATASTTDTTSDATNTTATTADADGSSGSTSTTSTARMIGIVFVGELLVLGVVLMTLSRRAPSMPFGAEALAGFW